MAAWSAPMAWSQFNYNGIEKSMRFTAVPGTYFWSNGSAWGTVSVSQADEGPKAKLEVLYGTLSLKRFELEGKEPKVFKKGISVQVGTPAEILF